MQRIIATLAVLAALLGLAASAAPSAWAAKSGSGSSSTYSKEEIKNEVEGFFEGTTEGLADVIEKAFADWGEPTGYIKGGEGGGAFIAGLRYGEGDLKLKVGGSQHLFWQGPSVGFDLGANFAKTFILIYNMTSTSEIFQRYPGVDGSAYIVGGFGLNYLRSGDITLAPIRTGVGLRLGASVGYLHFTRDKDINPF